MNDDGWIKLHRKFKEKGFYKKSSYVHLWVHILLKANHKEKEMMWNNSTITINKGEFVTGRKILSEETGIPEGTIENILKFFESEQQIEQQKTTKFRLIKVKKWENYQLSNSVKQQNEQQMNNRVTTDEQQMNTNKKDKKEKNDKKKDLPKSTASIYHNDAISFFDTHYQEIKGLKFDWSGKEIKAMQGLLSKLEKQVIVKNGLCDVNSLRGAFEYFITHINDSWILNNLSISNINSKFNETLNKIKNGTGKSTGESKQSRLNREYQAINELIQRVTAK